MRIGQFRVGARRARVKGGSSVISLPQVRAVRQGTQRSTNYNFIRDIAAIADLPLVMLVGPSFPAKTVPEFIAYAKANLDKLNMAPNSNVQAAENAVMILTNVDARTAFTCGARRRTAIGQ